MPPATKEPYDCVRFSYLKNLRKIVNDHPTRFDVNSTLIQRDHVIIGWKHRDLVKPITPPSGELNNVFDRGNNCFVKLTRQEMELLGVNRRMSFVNASDDAVANYGNREEYFGTGYEARLQQASHVAIQDATLQAIFESHIQARRPNQNHQASARAIHQAYHQTYDRAHRDYLRRYGHE